MDVARVPESFLYWQPFYDLLHCLIIPVNIDLCDGSHEILYYFNKPEDGERTRHRKGLHWFIPKTDSFPIIYSLTTLNLCCKRLESHLNTILALHRWRYRHNCFVTVANNQLLDYADNINMSGEDKHYKKHRKSINCYQMQKKAMRTLTFHQ